MQKTSKHELTSRTGDSRALQLGLGFEKKIGFSTGCFYGRPSLLGLRPSLRLEAIAFRRKGPQQFASQASQGIVVFDLCEMSF